MRSPEPLRFVAVTPAGVRHWLAQPQRSPERDVLEQLLLLDPRLPADLRALSVTLSCPLAQLARVLFVLNRQQAIEVATGPAVPAACWEQGLAALDGDLLALAGPGQGGVLASAEGLCLAASGWSAVEAERQAATLGLEGVPCGPATGRWWFARQVLCWSFSGSVDPGHPAWLGLARRLLRACGALSLEGRGTHAAG